MPIGGFVINIKPERKEILLKELASYPEIEIFGHDERGHLIAVLETESSEKMEALVQELSRLPGVISLDLAYLHGEDEVERIEAGELKPKIRFHRLRPEESS